MFLQIFQFYNQSGINDASLDSSIEFIACFEVRIYNPGGTPSIIQFV